MEGEIQKLKEEFNKSINHVEHVLKQEIDCTWGYTVRNKQYSRKNNLRIFGQQEHAGENLEEKVINFATEYLHKDIKPEGIEIIHKIRQPMARNGNRGSSETN